MLGFLWHYYACMEGKIYDITEWVACKVSMPLHSLCKLELGHTRFASQSLVL